MNAIQTAVSRLQDATAAAADLRKQLAGATPRLVVYFASPALGPQRIAAAMERAFAPATVIGCTTAGELVSGAMLKGGVVAMALDGVADLSVQLVAGLRTGAAGLDGAFEGFAAHFGRPVSALDPARHVGLVLIDGLSGAEERVIDAIGTRTNLTFVGGSAGDDLAFRATHVMAGGQAHADAALLVLLRLERPFSVIKTQSFGLEGHRLVATRVDAATRTVLEFDGRPATEVYAAAVGVPEAVLADQFMSHPLGLMVGDQPFVRSPQQVVGRGVRFYCAIEEGMELEVLRSADIVAETRAALARQQAAAGALRGIINFNCILRTLELDKKAQAQAYGDLFAAVPTIGFSTYGEAYLGHINQTATMLALH